MTRDEVLSVVRKGQSLAGASLCLVYLRDADLRRADLHNAYLDGADLDGANLRGANLAGASLRGANLAGTYLYGADLHGADLAGANLCGANLAGASLHGAYLAGASLAGANLRDAKGLSRSHNAASEILRRVARTPEEERWAMWPLAHHNWCVRQWRQVLEDAPSEIRDWARAALLADSAWGFGMLFEQHAEAKVASEVSDDP